MHPFTRPKGPMRFLFITLILCGSVPANAQFGDFFRPVPRPAVADTIKILESFVRFAPDAGADSMAWSYDINAPANLETGMMNAVLVDMKVRAAKTTKWQLRPIVVLPALKITESVRDCANVDAQVLTAVGGGISLQHLKWYPNGGPENKDGTKQGKWKSTFSFSPLTILISGDFSTPDATLDISPATTVGVFNNLLMIGIGYDLGEVNDRSRVFFPASVGVNFNN